MCHGRRGVFICLGRRRVSGHLDEKEDDSLRALFVAGLVVRPVVGAVYLAAGDAMGRRRNANGFLLGEYIAVCCLFFLLVSAAMAVPRDAERCHADAMTRELALDLQKIRQYSLANGYAASDSWVLSLRKDRYVIIRQFTTMKTRMYPKNVVVPLGNNKRKDVTFDGKGKPQGNMEIRISLADDPSYLRKIVVAAQTGRIRVE